MSKAVMISIQPYYVFLIIAKYMGWNIPQDKKVEVRKGFPKDKCWNKKVHIYCSKSKESFNRIPKEYQPLMRPFLGKVIGEFCCDYVDKCIPDYNPITQKFFNYDFWDKMGDRLEDCLSCEELVEYGQGQTLYGWQISELKIYDKSKELSEFYRKLPDKILENGDYDCRKNMSNLDICCIEYPEMSDLCEDCIFGGLVPLTRPPQSWCYVEELEE